MLLSLRIFLSLQAKPWLRPVIQALRLFAAPSRDAVYDRCVDAALDEPSRARKLGKRPGTSRREVLREMRRSMYRNAVYTQADGPARTAYDKAVVDLERARARHQAVADEPEWNWKVVCSLLATASLIVLIFGGPLGLLIAIFSTAALIFVLFWCGTAVWFNLRYCLLAALLGISCAVGRVRLGYRAAKWGEVLFDTGIIPVMDGMIRHLMGEDPDSLFVPQGTSQGLRAPRAPGFVVKTKAMEQLQRKLNHLDEGTIAVCGPRGVGKSTLLEDATAQAGFGVLIQAPATYAPHDFLVSLSVRLCQDYMKHEGYRAPDFARLSPFHRMLKSARRRVRRLGRWSSFALPAAALLVLGISSATRALYAHYEASASNYAETGAHAVQNWIRDVWDGHAVVTSVVISIAGIAWWLSRHDPWVLRTLGRLWPNLGPKLGMTIALCSVASVFLDPQIRQHAGHVPADIVFPAFLLAFFWLYAFLGSMDTTASLDLGLWTIHAKDVCKIIAACFATCLLYLLIHTHQTYVLLADQQNPLRIAGMVIGILIARAAGWRPPRQNPLS